MAGPEAKATPTEASAPTSAPGVPDAPSGPHGGSLTDAAPVGTSTIDKPITGPSTVPEHPTGPGGASLAEKVAPVGHPELGAGEARSDDPYVAPGVVDATGTVTSEQRLHGAPRNGDTQAYTLDENGRVQSTDLVRETQRQDAAREVEASRAREEADAAARRDGFTRTYGDPVDAQRAISSGSRHAGEAVYINEDGSRVPLSHTVEPAMAAQEKDLASRTYDVGATEPGTRPTTDAPPPTPQADGDDALTRVTSRIDAEQAEALKRAVTGAPIEPAGGTDASSLAKATQELSAAAAAAHQRGEVAGTYNVHPDLKHAAHPSAETAQPERHDTKVTTPDPAPTSAPEPASAPEAPPKPSHGVDGVADWQNTHGRVHLPGQYHSNASFEQVELHVNRQTGEFVVMGRSHETVPVRDSYDQDTETVPTHTLLDPATGMPISKPVGTVMQVNGAYINSREVGGSKPDYVKDYDGPLKPEDRTDRGGLSDTVDLTPHLEGLTPEKMVELARQLVDEGVEPRLALQGRVAAARAEGESSVLTTPNRRDYKIDLDEGKFRGGHDELAPLNRVREGVVDTLKFVQSELPLTGTDVDIQTSMSEALHAAAPGITPGEMQSERPGSRPGRISNAELEHARNAVAHVYASGEVEGLPPQALILSHFDHLIRTAEANGGYVTADNLDSSRFAPTVEDLDPRGLLKPLGPDMSTDPDVVEQTRIEAAKAAADAAKTGEARQTFVPPDVAAVGHATGPTAETRSDVGGPIGGPGDRPSENAAPAETYEGIDPHEKRITTIRSRQDADHKSEIPEIGAHISAAVERVRSENPNGKVALVLENAEGPEGIQLSNRVRELMENPDNPMLPSHAIQIAMAERANPDFTPDMWQEYLDYWDSLPPEQVPYQIEMARQLDEIVKEHPGSLLLVHEGHQDTEDIKTIKNTEAILKSLNYENGQLTPEAANVFREIFDLYNQAQNNRDRDLANLSSALASNPNVGEVITLGTPSHQVKEVLSGDGYNSVDLGINDVLDPASVLLEQRRNNPDAPLSDREIQLAIDAYSAVPRQSGETDAEWFQRMNAWVAEQRAAEGLPMGEYGKYVPAEPESDTAPAGASAEAKTSATTEATDPGTEKVTSPNKEQGGDGTSGSDGENSSEGQPASTTETVPRVVKIDEKPVVAAHEGEEIGKVAEEGDAPAADAATVSNEASDQPDAAKQDKPVDETPSPVAAEATDAPGDEAQTTKGEGASSDDGEQPTAQAAKETPAASSAPDSEAATAPTSEGDATPDDKASAEGPQGEREGATEPQAEQQQEKGGKAGDPDEKSTPQPGEQPYVEVQAPDYDQLFPKPPTSKVAGEQLNRPPIEVIATPNDGTPGADAATAQAGDTVEQRPEGTTTSDISPETAVAADAPNVDVAPTTPRTDSLAGDDSADSVDTMRASGDTTPTMDSTPVGRATESVSSTSDADSEAGSDGSGETTIYSNGAVPDSTVVVPGDHADTGSASVAVSSSDEGERSSDGDSGRASAATSGSDNDQQQSGDRDSGNTSASAGGSDDGERSSDGDTGSSSASTSGSDDGERSGDGENAGSRSDDDENEDRRRSLGDRTLEEYAAEVQATVPQTVHHTAETVETHIAATQAHHTPAAVTAPAATAAPTHEAAGDTVAAEADTEERESRGGDQGANGSSVLSEANGSESETEVRSNGSSSGEGNTTSRYDSESTDSRPDRSRFTTVGEYWKYLQDLRRQGGRRSF